MNKTLTALRVSRLYESSPFLNIQAGRSNSFFTLSNSHFSHSFKSALFSTNTPRTLLIQTSKFRKFLSCAVEINSFNLTGQTRNRHSEFDHDLCQITRCLFVECINRGDGGAIKYLRENGFFQCYETIIDRAEAADNGGALFLQPEKFPLIRCCIDHCKAENAGQTFQILPKEDFPDDINYTTSSACAPALFGSIQYNLHHSGGGGQYSNSNISRGLCSRGGAALACFRTNNHLIRYTHFVSCTGGSIISLEFGREPTTIDKCNIINNTHMLTQILTFSQATTLKFCFILKNTKPFSRPIVTGRKHSLELSDCTYDALGLDSKAGIIANNGHNYEGEETTIPFEDANQIFCVQRRKPMVNPFENFSYIFFFIAVFGIIFVHMSFIHPQALSDLYIHMFFDTDKESRRRRAHAVQSI
ncbi:hypothetical protein TVAG_305590 [Trichomonas vaginalis G3]|uniref:Right handed beta helix domain-containing protein n=1 Tax=Trichomonas vaginalis (strain ATCC PRA-98 / G3) TaxID=412133 RepID=A2ERD3_TRIV3|nr:hypothetical protein TVAGG3_1004080 [Trichomonas vaginalis G3]EAY04809.1 hypothetical protein TVAG_305590 [Trichomonas vaginalis G3]KAI5491010.1 hypothetical protein TVAGG3_1004080 [Trichomonas vaginalis G3]|eukprot:XP_001317032.1 hypothetical protein [Trichomonas vaginalis G3]